MTYFRRIYHPFMVTQPSLHNTAGGCVMLWTHCAPDCSQAPPADSDTVLGAAVIIPSLADLAEAASAMQTLIEQQGLPAKLATIASSSSVLGHL